MIVSNLKVSFGNKNILDDVSFTLNDKDHIGLVGTNGTGKSTLLKSLVDIVKKDSGTIKLNDETISYLKQEIPHQYNEMGIVDYIKNDIGIDILETKLYYLENNLNEDNMYEYSNVLNDYLALDGYSFNDNLSIILGGLNLKEDIDTKIGVLSGGEKIKVLLASILLQNSSILLLDEPTNNLDIDAIEWLENYLKKCTKKMIIVSHDEVFLNSICNKIYELKDGKINEYNMSYNDYLIEKEREYNHLLEEYTKSKDEQEKLKKQLQKAKEWSNKGQNKKAHNDNDKMANNFAKERTKSSNISKISKLLDDLNIPDFEEKKPINVFFNFDEDKSNKDIVLNNLICGYDNFQTPEFNFSIPFGTKINVVGSNGSGKTTLIKTIMGNIKPINGSVYIGNGVKIGYISQDTLNDESDITLLEYLKNDKDNVDLSMIFILLDKFNIPYEDKDKKYKLLSPGERTRVNLVNIALNKTNVLILDEITNHLDKEAIDLIYELVSSYQGTIISISHNRKYNEILNSDCILDINTGLLKQPTSGKSRNL